MRVAFAIHGSRGDLQPAVALGVELLRRGHQVSFAVPVDLIELTAAAGLPVRELAPSTAGLLASPLVKQRLRSKNPRTRMQALREVGSYGADTSERVMGDLADDADLLVSAPLAQERASTIAESRGISFAPLHYCPIRPTSRISTGYRPMPRPVNWAAWTVVDRAYWLSVAGENRQLRRRLGLPPVHGPLGPRLRQAGIPEIQAYDGALFPGLAAEWGPARPEVGFLVPDERTRSAMNPIDRTAEAIDRADDGPPPVYVGFGSMNVSPERIESIVAGLLETGARVLAHTDIDLPERTGLSVVTGAIDLERVLPRCVGAVHHGGAGTTAATIRAGIPSVVGWLSADQPLWAAALARVGAGKGNRLGRLGLAELASLTDGSLAAGARSLSARLTPPEAALDETCRILLSAARGKPMRE
ncbi:glycosyltransferase [Gordonia bronchialis]|uniref:glycosyltransferase n=1 Tax=Gordonia bronchialis TaxID=2054 RepID=UPI00226F9DB8|nr:nucleotide disphospho-sugar-binding domain-containing protein [Gordonia bronchialis]